MRHKICLLLVLIFILNCGTYLVMADKPASPTSTAMPTTMPTVMTSVNGTAAPTATPTFETSADFLTSVERYSWAKQVKGKVSRAEFAYGMSKAMDLLIEVSGQHFTDVKKSHKFYKQIDSTKSYIAGTKTKKIKVKSSKKTKKGKKKPKKKTVRYFYPKKNILQVDALQTMVALLRYTSTAAEKNAMKEAHFKKSKISKNQLNAFVVAEKYSLIPNMKYSLKAKLSKAQMTDLFANALKNAPALKDVFSKYFKVGATVQESKGDFSDPKRTAHILKHFNSITAENDMKMHKILNEKFEYDFTKVDKIVEFAEQNGHQLRGHTLIWHSSTPEWFFQDENGNPATKEVVLQRIHDYVTTVVSRYKGRIRCWDVVNEVLTVTEDSNGYYKFFGEDYSYIDTAFRAARAADPDCLLFYNDFGMENYHGGYADHLQVLLKLKESGTPIDGMGFQCHFKLGDINPTAFGSIINDAKEHGMLVEITELDMSSYFISEISDPNVVHEKRPPNQNIQIQARMYKMLFEQFAENDNVNIVTFWNTDDGSSWLNSSSGTGKTEHPLLFDRHLMPKSLFWEVIKVAK